MILTGPTTPELPTAAHSKRESNPLSENRRNGRILAVEPPGHSSPRGSRWYPRCPTCLDEFGHFK